MRRLTTCVLAVATVLLHAGAASAHEEITPASVPTGKPAFLVLSAANEAKVDLVRLILTAPAGLAFGATTREPPGWTVSRTDQLVSWSAGALKPDHFEQWGFEIEGADQPGTLTYRVTLGYADGTSDDASVDLAVTTAAAAPGGTAAATGAPSSSSSSTAGPYALAVAALALAAVALTRTVRRSPAAGAAPPPGPSTGEQDW
jgi:hypothetical protein